MGLSNTTINIIVKLTAIIWSMTFIRTVVLMLCGNLYTKASKSSKTALIPIFNMFTMLEIVELSPFLGILFFVPILNLIVLVLMSIKLGTVYNANTKMKVGLILLPFIFYPLLARSKVYYKITNDEYLRALDNAKNDSVNLMTQDEINNLNKEEDIKIEKVDSIFKTAIEVKAAPEPYRAMKIDKEVLDKAEKLEFHDTTFKPIEKVEEFEHLDTTEKQKQKIQGKMFTGELEKEENVEYFDL